MLPFLAVAWVLGAAWIGIWLALASQTSLITHVTIAFLRRALHQLCRDSAETDQPPSEGLKVLASEGGAGCTACMHAVPLFNASSSMVVNACAPCRLLHTECCSEGEGFEQHHWRAHPVQARGGQGGSAAMANMDAAVPHPHPGRSAGDAATAAAQGTFNRLLCFAE